MKLTESLGAPGWSVFVQPLLELVNPSLRPEHAQVDRAPRPSDTDVVDLDMSRVVVSARSLAMALGRLRILVLSNPSPGLCRRILGPVIVQLWVLCSWANPPQAAEQRFSSEARGLVRAYLRLSGEVKCVLPIVQNLICTGAVDTSRPLWCYHLNAHEEIEVRRRRGQGSGLDVELDWNGIDHKAAALVDLITGACSSDEVAAVFLHLLRRWVASAQKPLDLEVRITPQDRDETSSVQGLVEVTLLQKLMQEAPGKLVNQFHQLVDVICQVLRADGRSALGDDLVAVVLSLLNLVVTAPNFQKSDFKLDELEVIEGALNRIGSGDRPDVSTTARNLEMLLRYRDDLGAAEDLGSTPTARQVEDRKTYSLAMSYIAGERDNPPPVVSEGLDLLSSLVVAESPILDITAVTVLMSNLLKENEDYINLRVIKVFTQLANKHPRSTVQELLENYLDAHEKASTDIRLRFGEALVQVVERLGETFSGEVAKHVCDTLLSIAGRRGYRPKTEAEQARRERLRSMRKQKAEGDADEDEDDDVSDDGAMAERDRANRDIIAQLMQGWESRRGSEDVRIRASSLSILGSALETHLVGIEPRTVSNAVDLCVNVLAMEREPEYGILRRAAVVAILSFVKALDEARESKRTLGLGLTETSRADMQSTLAYVAETDNDGLVQQHARDAVESLENWRVRSLLPQPEPGLRRLAGLLVGQGGAPADASDGRRPKIEEVE